MYTSYSTQAHLARLMFFVPGFNVITLDLNALDLNDLCHNGIFHRYDLNTHTHTSIIISIRLNAYAHIFSFLSMMIFSLSQDPYTVLHLNHFSFRFFGVAYLILPIHCCS